MYIQRNLEESARRAAKGYPIVVITGPRQSGKTTLAKHVFHEKPFASLEDLDERAFAEEDPRGYLARFPKGATLDEVQNVPSLLSYLQTLVDKEQRTGLFVLTGSRQFDLMAGITQSLAGRSALLNLLPLSLDELQKADRRVQDLNALLYTGLYPAVYDRSLDPASWYANYVRTYVERDVRALINIRNLGTFQRFLKLCAARSGQLLNLSGLASDAGISHTTAREWVSVLESSYVIHLLAPHHRNFNKRLIKTPKLYFHDTGLACHLLGIETTKQLDTHALRGSLFETWVLSELLKDRFNRGRPGNLFFWRDRAGNEIDVLIEHGDKLTPLEIKSGRTIARDFASGLRRWRDMAGNVSGTPRLIYGGDESLRKDSVRFVAWRDLPGETKKLKLENGESASSTGAVA